MTVPPPTGLGHIYFEAYWAEPDGCAWDEGGLEAALRAAAEGFGIESGRLAQPVRVAVTVTTVSPPLFGTLVLLGRERTLGRLAVARGLVAG